MTAEFVPAAQLYDVGSRTTIAHPSEQATDDDVRCAVRALEEEIRTDGGTETSDTEQGTLLGRPEPQVVEPTRDGRTLVCPDCSQSIGASRGGHDLPDGRRVHGWACGNCQNVFPGTCHSQDAPTWNDQIRGVEVEFRDGTRRFVAVLGGGRR